MIDGSNGSAVRVRTFREKRMYRESRISAQSPLHTGDIRHRMIPATTDERLEIQVVVTNKFDFKGQRYVRAKVDFDGGVITTSKYISNNSIRSRGLNDRSFKHSFGSMKGKKPNGEWMYFGFTFGALEIAKDLVLSDEEEAKQAANRGTIKVTLQRGRAVRTEEDAEATKILPAIPSSKTSEKVIVEHCKTHGFERTLGGKTTPSLEKWTFTPAQGDAGVPIVYTFTCVSQDIVEANTPSESVKQRVLAKASVNKTDSNARPTLEAAKNIQTKRTIEQIDLTSDDEGPLKIMKIETPIEHGLLAIPASRKEHMDTEANKTKAGDDSAREPKQNTDIKVTTEATAEAAGTKANANHAIPVQTAAPKAAEKEKKRKEIMEELEDFKLQQKINQLQRALRRLDEE